jgi:hypothetical protein
LVLKSTRSLASFSQEDLALSSREIEPTMKRVPKSETLLKEERELASHGGNIIMEMKSYILFRKGRK